MAKKQSVRKNENEQENFKVMPSDEVILEHFRAYLHEYFTVRNPNGIDRFLAQSFTAFGSAGNEIFSTPDQATALYKADLQRYPGQLSLIVETFKAERLNDLAAVVWGQATLNAKDGPVQFAIENLRTTAVYSLIDGKLMISHMHISLPLEAENKESESLLISRIDDTLHETAEKYRLIFENSPVGILHYDSNGIVKDCNQKFLSIIGTTKEKIAGLNMLALPD
ncbi:MAG: PAS domain S-box protein, partial [Candidatus Riflebacteria bacterium]|nr:PAS domain S-box protein [Candidatus Riflebacteria bacterium]